jgi:hypothetical protein
MPRKSGGSFGAAMPMTPLLLVVKCSGDPMLTHIGIMWALPDASRRTGAARNRAKRYRVL